MEDHSGGAAQPTTISHKIDLAKLAIVYRSKRLSLFPSLEK